ncbi:Type 1 glutamine amidotransferase-like domain-containing protein [Pseudomonas syringae group sp. J309-1]|uniref:Type 1 glutamine amidotransferase-like domain-containing protein n=1 Tax=Pseudomonas syringae group sp. J309-1 TaxID=3079588 RepID=UPI002908DB2B|nr:Type 1 glutamine amidotransferase-like domain-containing protein [Pseudomonas syringae group sp. J309-1]MDU8357470.1 Type 1 glutamine amidotransferase-like domain-containing protein [Pseudomonas syringae group sp. J309-1]
MESTIQLALNERLLHWVEHAHPRIGYISAAPDASRVYFERARQCYLAQGMELSCYVDSNSSEDELTAVFACEVIHLSGGNTFSFLHWLKQRGLLAKLRRYALSGGVLIGVSAGAILMTPSVASAELCADVREVGLADDAALSLIGFHFWPHFEPQQELEPRLMQLASTLANVYQCPDGAAIVVEGDQIELFGSALLSAR